MGRIKQEYMANDTCIDSRPCYARLNGKCMVLRETYMRDGECPFQKVRREDKAIGRRKKT